MTDRQWGLRTVEGSRLFAAFLERNGISYEKAGRALGVTRVTVGHWATGHKRASGLNPALIETWTRGDVPASSWEDPVGAQRSVAPFCPSSPSDDDPAPDSTARVARDVGETG